MRAVLKTIKGEPCCSREVSDNERDTFSNYTFLQRWYAALNQFVIPDTSSSYKHIELPTKYKINRWVSQDEENPKIWNALRSVRELKMHSTSEDKKETIEFLDPADPEDVEPCTVFTKIVHLLNPIDVMKNSYVCPEHPLLPQKEDVWKNTVNKIHSSNNQAYVDAVANYVLSRFRELDLTPHCVLSYGSYTAISKSYQFNISNEFESFRQCRWFWKGMESHHARITLLNKSDNPEFDEFYKQITTCPFDDEELILDMTELNDTESITSVSFDAIELDDETVDDAANGTADGTANGTADSTEELDALSLKSSGPSDIDSDSISKSDSETQSEESYSSCDSNPDINIWLEIPNMPVIIINQEAQEGVMDDLLEEDELDGYDRESQGWEARWIAWLFQVVAVLSFLQKVIFFTHNDLHSNNIIWRKTDKKYLFYKLKDGTVWRVPTYGKIFSLIDFGRAIFKLGKRQWISDDHWPNQDAGDQYNFGPFYDATKPKCTPNNSFDLCRLAVSLIDGLFDEPPPKKKGKKVPIMSSDGDWVVYETRSQLYNLLWSWTVDDAGQTVFENDDGSEKYDGFELYIHIAQDVHSAVPREQLSKPVFQGYIWKNAVPNNETVYPLDV
jgi:hypothetical protein